MSVSIRVGGGVLFRGPPRIFSVSQSFHGTAQLPRHLAALSSQHTLHNDECTRLDGEPATTSAPTKHHGREREFQRFTRKYFSLRHVFTRQVHAYKQTPVNCATQAIIADAFPIYNHSRWLLSTPADITAQNLTTTGIIIQRHRLCEVSGN